jgi:uncharacterized protein YndB with AHSA1/START domain
MVETITEVLQPAAANEIVISRVFRAPRAMVWGAFADPWQVGQWWGPAGFTTTMLQMDLRAGGKWRLVMHGPDGTNYPNEMTFTEVVPFERIGLELTGCREGAERIHFHQTIVIETTTHAMQYLKGMREGWSSRLDKFADFLKTL